MPLSFLSTRVSSAPVGDAAGRDRARGISISNLAAIAGVALLYYVTGKLGLRMAFLHASATPVWPPSGIALAALVLIGSRVWPGVFLGAFAVNITTAGSLATTLGIATGNTLEAVIGSYLVHRFANGRRAFERSQDIIKFWVFAGMVSATVAATFGVTSLCITGFADWAQYRSVWTTWWMGDATGAFLFGSILIVWSTTQPRWSSGQAMEAALLMLTVVLVGLVVFLGRFHGSYVCLPVLLWAAFRFGRWETAVASIILSGIAVWATLRGSGPLVGATRNESLLQLQAFMTISAATALCVAALVSERRRTANALWEAHDLLEKRVEERTEELSRANEALRTEIDERAHAEDRFRKLLESAPDAMLIVNEAGEIVLANSQVERLFEYTRDELIGQPAEILVPRRLRHIHAAHRGSYYSDPRVRAMGLSLDLYGCCKDGTEFPVAISFSPIETAEGLVVCAAIRDMSEQKRLERQLADTARRRSEDLRDFAVSVQRAQEDERRRIARELHDELGQRLTGLKLSLQVLEDDMPGSAGTAAGERLQRLGQEIDTMIIEVRRLSYNLRPAALDDFGPIAALQMLCKEFEKLHKIRTRFQANEPGDTRYDSHVDIALYRIAQEALSNVAKHARATEVSVRLSRHNHAVVITVEDNGRGFDVDAVREGRKKREGLGLISMMERSHLLGGTFQVHSVPREGTKVEVELPLTLGRSDETNQNTHSG